MSGIVDLAIRQLDAYNRSDLETFIDCYHDEVRVFNHDELSIEGKSDFRKKYRILFEQWTFGAAVPQRINLGSHCVDLETWWRIDPSSGERTEGKVIVRYQELDGLIGTVQFLR
jgi:hypothetical protein